MVAAAGLVHRLNTSLDRHRNRLSDWLALASVYYRSRQIQRHRVAARCGRDDPHHALGRNRLALLDGDVCSGRVRVGWFLQIADALSALLTGLGAGAVVVEVYVREHLVIRST